MRPVTKLAVGSSLVSAGTALGLVLGGVFAGSATLVVADPLAPAVRADGLRPFDDCTALRDWYVDRAVRDVGPYGWAGQVLPYASEVRSPQALTDQVGGVPLAGKTDDLTTPTASSAITGQASSATGTNTQEAGVDEPDVAKTDGRLVVRIIDARTLVISDATGAFAHELGRLRLPGADLYDPEFLLVGQHVLVLAGDAGPWVHPGLKQPGIADGTEGRPLQVVSTGTKVLDVDISDPGAPSVAHVDTYSGRLIAARQYGTTVRLVTATGRPDLPWTYPTARITEQQATEHNLALVRATTIEDWLPTVTTDGRRSALVGCDQVMHPGAWAGADTVTVSTFAGDDAETRTSVGLTADAQVVYSSSDRLYVASARLPDPRNVPDPRVLGGAIRYRPEITHTDLHAFALDGPSTAYVGSGTVAGDVRDRWSLDEYDGVLRVAWTRLSSIGRNRNGMSTFTAQNGSLVRLGQLRGLGIDENLQSVRWFGGLAVLVTYRRIDPLYTIDLTDQADPVARGVLKVRGYSGYLHPLGNDRLLGLGVEANTNGTEPSGQAATFDISDLTAPRRTDRIGLGPNSHPTAIDEPRAFTWLPDRSTAITAVVDWSTGHGRLVALTVSADGALTVRDLPVRVNGGQTRVLPLADGRIAVIDPATPGGLQILTLG